MATHHNPALYEEPRNQPMSVPPPIPRESLFLWIENTGRFLANEVDEVHLHKMVEDLDDILDPEIYAPIKENETEEEQL